MARIIRKVAIIGGGTMGSGIAQKIAQSGVNAVVKEVDEAHAVACRDKLHRQWDKVAGLGKLNSTELQSAKSHFSVTSSYDDIRGVDLVIEAVFEDMEVKKAVFRELNSLLPADVIFATNSSSLSIDEIASITNRPDCFMGTHFFNPPVKALLVELIRGQATSDKTYSSVKRFIETSLGNTSILVKGCPGYLVNRLLLPYLNEAARLLVETRLTFQEIDVYAKKFGLPMGPFELLDFVGIDIASSVAKILHDGYGERATPTTLMYRLVELGRVGDKVGVGFYNKKKMAGFEDIQTVIDREYPNRRELDIEEGFKRMLAGLCNEALMCLEEGIAPKDVIEEGATKGIFFPMALEGPLHYTQEKYGFANLLADLKRFEREYGMRFKPATLLEQLVAEDKKIFKEIEEEEW